MFLTVNASSKQEDNKRREQSRVFF